MAVQNNANIGFEKQIWDAACVLWGHIPAAEYRKVIVGLIFLRYISSAFEKRYQQLVEEGDGFEDDKDAYAEDNIFFVPEDARWSKIASAAHTPEIGTVIDDAMRAIEKENTTLKNVLPKNYASPDLDKRVLGEVVDLFTNMDMGDKVNINLLTDDDVKIVEDGSISLIVIHVPRADFNMRPVYVGENPYKGTYKRNHEGDYHATEHEIRGMIRDQNPEGNDNQIIEYYTMDDIDKETLRKYRQIFEIRNDGHVWNALDDKSFLDKLGGYRKDRKTGVEGLTLAGLLMFGTGQAIRERFDNVFMDYRNESQVTADIRWNDRITYDGTWENNLFNFFTKVTPKLTEDLKKPFKLEGGVQRIDDTPVHKAVREGFVNMIIHADYLMDAGVLKVIKKSDAFEFTNPGILKLPLEDIYRGGNSKSRNPHMQTMLRLVGFGDNAGSGFPTILEVWKSEGWKKPELIEDTNLDQVTLVMKMEKESDDESAEKSAESAEKSADSKKMKAIDLSERQKQILAYMDAGVEYSTEQVAEKIGLKGPRTRQLLNELVNMELLACIGTTKRRRYIKV